MGKMGESVAGHLLVVGQTNLGVLFVLRKELLGSIGEHLQQRLITGFAADEVLIVFGRILAVNGERILQFGVEAIQGPIAGGHGLATV